MLNTGSAVAVAAAPAPTLVERLRLRDPQAFEELVRTHGGAMLAGIRRILRDEEAARDALQEAFLAAYRSLDRFEGRSSLSTWLYRIALNAALAHCRRRSRAREVPIEPLLPRFGEHGTHAEPVAPWHDVDAEIDRERLLTRVRESIDRLPPRYREVLMLRDVEQLDTAETAEILGIEPTTVRVRLHRARQALCTLVRDAG